MLPPGWSDRCCKVKMLESLYATIGVVLVRAGGVGGLCCHRGMKREHRMLWFSNARDRLQYKEEKHNAELTVVASPSAKWVKES